MTSDQYVVWFVLMAVGIGLILGLGTLTMAGLLHRPHWHRGGGGHHHWYDRFHHAA